MFSCPPQPSEPRLQLAIDFSSWIVTEIVTNYLRADVIAEWRCKVCTKLWLFELSSLQFTDLAGWWFPVFSLNNLENMTLQKGNKVLSHNCKEITCLWDSMLWTCVSPVCYFFNSLIDHREKWKNKNKKPVPQSARACFLNPVSPTRGASAPKGGHRNLKIISEIMIFLTIY